MRWMVLFDSLGVDMLVPCDEMIAKATLEWLDGNKFKSELTHHCTIAMHRLRANLHRFPELWVYDFMCSSEEEMRQIWNDHPQEMADLVRQNGKCLKKSMRRDKIRIK